MGEDEVDDDDHHPYNDLIFDAKIAQF